MASKCFEKYKKEWSKEAKIATLQHFGDLPDTLVKHIAGEPACVAYSTRVYWPASADGAIPQDYNQKDDDIFLFTFESFAPFTGPEGLKLYKSYSSLETMMDDGWVID